MEYSIHLNLTIVEGVQTMPKAYNEYVDNDGKTKCVLYATKIVEFDRKDSNITKITLNSGGYTTNHTKKCMNIALAHTHYRVVQKSFQWYIQTLGNDSLIPFKDNIQLVWITTKQ